MRADPIKKEAVALSVQLNSPNLHVVHLPLSSPEGISGWRVFLRNDKKPLPRLVCEVSVMCNPQEEGSQPRMALMKREVSNGVGADMVGVELHIFVANYSYLLLYRKERRRKTKKDKDKRSKQESEKKSRNNMKIPSSPIYTIPFPNECSKHGGEERILAGSLLVVSPFRLSGGMEPDSHSLVGHVRRGTARSSRGQRKL